MKGRILDLFASFRFRNYLWLWLIVALTNTGKWIFTLAVTWQVYDMTGSSFWSGALLFASMIPNIIGGPIVGVFADKIERRKLIYTAIGLSLTVLFLLTIMTLTHVLAPIGMAALALLFGLGVSTLSVSVNSILPTLVPKDHLYNAYSLQAVGQRGTEFIGPLIAAPILSLFGIQAVYIFGAIIYAFSLIFVGLVSTTRLNEEHLKNKEGFFIALSSGIKYIRHHSTILGMVILVGFHCGLTMAFLGMLPSFVKEDIGAESSFYSVLMSMVGLGSIFATLFMAGIKKHQLKMKLFWISAYISGLSLVFLGMTKTNMAAIVAILLVGSSQALFMTLTIAFIQEATEEHVRGRVTSVYFFLAAGLMSVANWGYGWLGSIIDPQFIMVTTGLLFTVVVVIFWMVTIKKTSKKSQLTKEELGA